MSLLNTYVGYNLSPKLEQVLPSFNSTDLDFLNKKIYSYPSEDDLSGVSASDRALLLNYYKFLNETYFNGGSSINVSENVNTILFSLCKNIIENCRNANLLVKNFNIRL